MKPAAPKKNRRRVLLLGVIAVAAVLPLAWRELRKNFKIRHLEIAAPWPLKEKSIREKLPLLVGASLFDIDGNLIFQQLSGNRWIRAAVVRKVLPDTLRIELEVRKPAAMAPMEGGRFYLLDSEGNPIERAISPFLGDPAFPIVSWDRENYRSGWEFPRVLQMVTEIQSVLGKTRPVSQTALGPFPFFRLYLESPRVEVSLSFDTWEEQLPRLQELLRYPWPNARIPNRISLLFPKKAIVSREISQ